jgi:hypothetical protein
MAQEAYRVTVNPKVKVILQTVTDDKPDYEIYGQTKCLSCTRWCWLDEHSFPAVLAGKASPICIECAKPQISEWTPIGNAKDL